MIKRGSTVLFAVLLLFGSNAQGQWQGTWTTNNGVITIASYTGTNSVITIPSEITEMPVTQIGDYAFFDLPVLTSVVMPNSVTNIGNSAFYNCTYLTNVLFSSNLLTVSDSAFYHCGMTDVIIPTGVMDLGTNTFNNCYALTSITIPSSITNIGSFIFYDDLNLTTVIIPNSVTSIGDYAFYQCRNLSLSSLALPNALASIGALAFWECANIVTIPDSVTNIGDGAFSGNGIRAIVVGSNNPVYSSIDGILFDKNQTTLLQYPGGTAFYQGSPGSIYTVSNTVTGIGNYAFYGIDFMTSITIPTGVTHIGDYAFESDWSLQTVAIPNSVTQIGIWAFANTGFTNIAIPAVTSIPSYAFAYDNLISVAIPNSVGSIGDHAFFDSTKLTNVTIPDSVTNIGESAFYSCAALDAFSVSPNNSYFSSINGVLFDKNQTTLIQYPPAAATSYLIPSSVTSIANSAFSGDTSLISITIPNGVTNIGSNAFDTCRGLTGVAIPSSVTSIGEGPFGGCWNLSAITVATNNPNYTGVNGVLFDKRQSQLIQYPAGSGSFYYDILATVTSIGGYAFSICIGLQTVLIPNGVTNIGDWAFYECGLESLSLPDGLESIGTGAFYLANSLRDSITIPASVSSIGSSAFTGMNVTNFYFQGNAPGVGNDWSVFAEDYNATVYFPAGATGWGQMFDGVPAALCESCPAIENISWNTPSPMAFGDALGPTELDAAATVPGTFVYSPPSGTVLVPGNHTISAIFTPSDTTDYVVITNTVNVTVEKGMPVLAWPPPIPILYGTPLSSNQLNATANMSGSFAYHPPVGSVLNLGTNTLSVVFTPTDTVDYTNTTTEVSLVVVAPFSLAIAPATLLTATNLQVGGNYQLQVLQSGTWSDVGSPLVNATNSYATYVDGVDIGSSYRLQALPAPTGATATANEAYGYVFSITVTSGGSGYLTPPLVSIVGGGGGGAQAVASISNGVVTAVNIQYAGSGYSSVPVVIIAPPPIQSVFSLSFAAGIRLDCLGLAAGQTYQLQASPSLTAWTNVAAAFQASSNTNSQYYVAPEGSLFFRLLNLP
jgi:hypothetical protein